MTDAGAKIVMAILSLGFIVTGIVGIKKREMTIGARVLSETKKGESAITWGMVYIVFGLIVLWALFLGGDKVLLNISLEYMTLVSRVASTLDIH